MAAHQVHPLAAVQTEYSLWTPSGPSTRCGRATPSRNDPRCKADDLAANRDRYTHPRSLAADLGTLPRNSRPPR